MIRLFRFWDALEFQVIQVVHLKKLLSVSLADLILPKLNPNGIRFAGLYQLFLSASSLTKMFGTIGSLHEVTLLQFNALHG